MDPALLQIQAIRHAAVVDATTAVKHVRSAAELVAMSRFDLLWPRPNRAIGARTALRRWWLSSFERQLNRPSERSTLEGALAESTIKEVAVRAAVDQKVAVHLVGALGQDASATAREVTQAALRFLAEGMHGRLARHFPQAGSDGPVEHAIAQQWYLRVFRDTVSRALTGKVTHPVTDAEETIVAAAFRDGRTARLYGDQQQPLFLENHVEIATRTWAGMLRTQRADWLTTLGAPERLAETDPFETLPPPIRARFINQYPPREVERFQPGAIVTGTASERAAAMFNAPVVVTPSQQQRDLARRLFSSRYAIPGISMPSTKQPFEAFAQYTSALGPQRQGHRVGLPSLDSTGRRRLVFTPELLHEAIRLRRDGESFEKIANVLSSHGSVSHEHVRTALIRAGVHQPRTIRETTNDRDHGR